MVHDPRHGAHGRDGEESCHVHRVIKVEILLVECLEPLCVLNLRECLFQPTLLPFCAREGGDLVVGALKYFDD